MAAISLVVRLMPGRGRPHTGNVGGPQSTALTQATPPEGALEVDDMWEDILARLNKDFRTFLFLKVNESCLMTGLLWPHKIVA
jgi:hypothetical protein